MTSETEDTVDTSRGAGKLRLVFPNWVEYWVSDVLGLRHRETDRHNHFPLLVKPNLEKELCFDVRFFFVFAFLRQCTYINLRGSCDETGERKRGMGNG